MFTQLSLAQTWNSLARAKRIEKGKFNGFIPWFRRDLLHDFLPSLWNLFMFWETGGYIDSSKLNLSSLNG